MVHFDSSSKESNIFEVDENENEDCGSWTTLPCQEIVAPFPVSLDWASSHGGLNDANGVGTGFTAIAPPSSRAPEDGTPANSNVPGYEPSKININATAGTLSLETNKGIFYRRADNSMGNSQLNALAVGLNAANGAKSIQTKIVSLPDPKSQKYQQAGLWFGLGESDYVKFVVISHVYGTAKLEVQLLYELNDVYQSEETLTDVIPVGSDVILQMILDPTTNRVVGFFSTDNGVTFKSVGPGIQVNPSLFSGTNLNGQLSSNASFAGIFGTHRNSSTPLVYNFTHFTIEDISGTVENKAPTLTRINNPASIDANSGEQIIELTGISAGAGEEQELTVTASSSNPDLIPNPVVEYTSPNSTGLLKYTPVAEAFGQAEISVVVTDNGSNTPPNQNSITRTFTVSVNNPDNKIPYLDPIADPEPIDEDSPAQTIELTGISAGQGEVQTLTVTAKSDNIDLIANPTVTYTSPNATGTLTFTPLENASGTANITVTVTDDGSDVAPAINSFSQTFSIKVNQINDAPFIDEIANQVTDVGTTLGPISFTVGDVDTDANQLIISASSANQSLIPNENIVIGGTRTNRTFTIDPVAEENGSSIITFTVSDGEVESTQTFRVDVGEVTSVENENFAAQLKIYPNPSQNNVVIVVDNQVLGETFIRIIDFAGRTKRSINFNKQDEKVKYNLSIDDLAQGSYIIQVRQKGLITYKKLIKI